MVNLPAKHVVTDTGHTADHNTIVDALTALTLGVGGPTSVTRARIRLAADNANSVPNTTWTAVVMDTMDVDSDGLWVQATKSRLLIQQAGTYVLEGQLVWNANVTGFRDAAIWKNGVGTGTVLGETVVAANPSAGNLTIQNVDTGPVQLNAGDYVELGGYQNSTGALLLRQNGSLGSWLGLRRVDAGNVAYGTGGSQLIGKTVYAPAAAVTTATTSSVTPVAVDATNLSVTFTAPASGSVLVKLGATPAITAGTTYGMYWALMSAGSVLANTAVYVATNTPSAYKNVSIPVTGLTPGQQYTFLWAQSAEQATVTAATRYGGTSGGGYGPAVMEVYDATIGAPNNSFPQNGITQPFIGTKIAGGATGWVSNAGTAPGSFADVDATNAVISFIAPASGIVVVDVEGLVTSTGSGVWALRDTTTNAVAPGTAPNGNVVTSALTAGSTTNWQMVRTRFRISGLIAGQVYSYKLSHAIAAGNAGTMQTYQGDAATYAIRMYAMDGVASPNMTQQSPNPFLLGRTSYSPATPVDNAITSVTSVDLDAANLKTTFIAPASGQVLVRLSAQCYQANSGTGGWWCLRSGGVDVPGTRQYVTTTATITRPAYEQVVTGLTPGQQYTYTWGGFSGNVSFAFHTRYGDDGTQNPYGAAVMEVWDGTAGQGSVQTPPGLTTLGRFYGYKTSGTALVSNTWTVIPINTVVDDPLGKWVAANNAWTAPATGTYLVTASVNFGASASDRYFVALAINGTRVPGRSEVKADATNGNELVYTRQVRLNVGDTVALMAISTTAAVTINGAVGDESSTALEIIQLPDTGHAPSAASASQVIGARVSKSANQTLTAASTKYALTFDTEDKDAGGFYDPTAPTRLTVPAGAGGTYRVRAQAVGNIAAAAYIQVSILKNGNAAEVATAFASNATGSQNFVTAATERLLDLNPGDYVEAYALVTGATLQIGGGDNGALTFFEIERVNSIAMTDPTARLGDMVVRGAGGALSRLAVGADGYVPVADSTQPLGLAWKRQVVHVDTVTLTQANDVTLANSTSWTAVSAGTNGASVRDLSINADVGDVLEFTLRCRLSSGADYFHMDVATVVSGSMVNSISRNAAIGAGSGLAGLVGLAASTDRSGSYSQIYVVQAGDVSGGVVTLRMVWRNNGNAAISNSLSAQAASMPLHYAVKNLGRSV